VYKPFFIHNVLNQSAHLVLGRHNSIRYSDVPVLFSLQQEIRQQKSQHSTIGGVLSDKVNRKSLLIGIGCMFFQQASGINVIIFNMHYIFENFGSKISAWTSSIVIAVIQV